MFVFIMFFAYEEGVEDVFLFNACLFYFFLFVDLWRQENWSCLLTSSFTVYSSFQKKKVLKRKKKEKV
jgi:hypothetical protein